MLPPLANLQPATLPSSNPGRRRVVVAMSGGVDSSLAAALLLEQGYDVTGVMMRLWAEETPGHGRTNKCCTLDAVEDARQVADSLGIPFYLINVEQPFREQVVDFTIAGYLSGKTPNPCIQCNRHIRFDYLFNYALSLGADFLATGHYARVERDRTEELEPAGYRLLAGVDQQKDQSYVLYVLSQHHLAHLLLPVGHYTKQEVRQMAAARELPVAGRHDSQDLCFLADGDYRRFLQDWAPEGAIEPGPMVDSQGRLLGEHRGLPFYTVGQRKGLGLAAGEPLYVIRLEPAENALIVGPAHQLGRRQFSVCQVNWLDGQPPAGTLEAMVKIRYRAWPAAATVQPLPGDRAQVTLAQPLRDITPGQGAVFYQGEVCLGGGLIE